MTFSEIGFDADSNVDKGLSTLETELSDINSERSQLCSGIESQWPNIPPEVVNYLANNCPRPELMTEVLGKLGHLSKTDPKLLSDTDLMPYLIDGLIIDIENDTVDFQRGLADEKETQVSTTQTVLNEIISTTANLTGRAKLAAAREYLNDPKIPETVRSELVARFDQIEATLASMSAVFTDPTSQSEFEWIISTTSFDFGASNIAETFAPIITQVETSDKFTTEQKFRLREIVTGSDAQNSLAETMADENGHEVPRFTENNKREFRKGVSGYVEGHGRQMIEARAGDRMVTKDVTGWSGEDVGFLIEATHMWNMYDSFGVTGFIEDVYKIDFAILGDGNAFDPIQITHLRQVMSHLTVSFEGYDGDIANLTEHKTLIQNQSRLLSETQTAFGFEDDRSGTTNVLRRLGLEDEKGNPNMEVIKSFDDYTKRHYGAGAPDQLRLVEYLSRLHPEFVAPLSKAERAMGKLVDNGGVWTSPINNFCDQLIITNFSTRDSFMKFAILINIKLFPGSNYVGFSLIRQTSRCLVQPYLPMQSPRLEVITFSLYQLRF